MHPGLIGGIVGTVGGVLGAAVGTFFSIWNTSGPRERTLVIRLATLMWAGGTALLVGMWLTPQPYRSLLWIPYGVLLPIIIRVGNRRQEQIRHEEADDGPDRSSSPPR